MAETIIHEVCLRENQSGQFEFSFKPLEGYMFTGEPYIYSINGEEWDTTGGVMTVTFGTDYREDYGDGIGIHGTETVNVVLNYDIPDLNPTDDNTNKISVDFFVKKMLSYCLSQYTTHYITFGGLGGAPIINGHTPITGQTSGSYWGQNSEGVYVFAGMATGNYGWYVDSEVNACTLYSEQGNINITGTNSKTVFVTTSVYTGNITLYWGTIQINVTGDFDKATMLFDNGHRNTLNWFRYRESCQFNLTPYRPYGGTTKTQLTRRDDCEIWATNALRRELLTYSSDYQLVSNTNGYSFSQVYQGRTRYQTTQTDYEILEPYGRLYRRGDTLISIKSYGTVGHGTWEDVSHDNGKTWTRIDGTSFSDTIIYPNVNYSTSYRPYWFWSDVVYAGFSETHNNHVWYALVHYTGAGNYIFGYHLIVKSVDDAATFNRVIFDGPNQGHDFEENTQPANYTANINRGRLWVDLEKNYIFVFFPTLVKKLTNTTTTNAQWVLYRGFPSEEGTGNGGEMKPVLAGNSVSGFPATYDGIEFNYTDHLLVSSYFSAHHIPLSVNDNGLCIFTTKSQYLVSWNFGLNWTVEVDLPTINDTHTNGNSYTYPEYGPTPVFWQGINLILTSNTQPYSANHSYTRNTIPNQGLLYGAMEVTEKNEEGWVTGDIPESWDDLQTFGPPSGLTSQSFGTLENWSQTNCYIAFGDNIFGVTRYNIAIDPSSTSFYWHTYNVLTNTETVGNTNAQNPVGFAPNIAGGNYWVRHHVHGNDLFAHGNINGPIQNVDEDWKLYRSTDLGVTWTQVFSHPNSSANLYSYVMDHSGIDPNMLIYSRTSPYVFYSGDHGNTWSQLTNVTQVNIYLSSPKMWITDGYLWIIEGRTGSTPEKNYIIPTSAMSDGANWSTYEIPTSVLAHTSSAAKAFVADNQKAIMQDGAWQVRYTTDRGQTWTLLTSITTTDNVTYSSSQIQAHTGFYVNRYNGKFLIRLGSFNYVETTDFVTWNPLAYDPTDVDGDNASHTENSVVGLQDGNWYLILNDVAGYQVSARITNLSASALTSPPTIDRIIESWNVIKEYTVTDTNPDTNPNYVEDGLYGTPMSNITKDYEFPDGTPRLLIARPWGAEIIPPPPSPVVTDGSLVEEISYPPFPPTEDLVFDVPAGYMRIKHIYSDKPFGIMFIDKNSRLHRMDGIFNIVSCSLCEPLIVKSSSDQIINYGDQEELPTEGFITVGTSIFFPTIQYTTNIGGHGFHYDLVYPGNPTRQEYEPPFSLLNNPNIGGYYLYRNRSDVPGRNNKKNVGQLTSYETNYEVQIPTSYLFSGVQLISPPNYGDCLIWFPPLDRPYINVIGMKLYADPYGTPYVDGYYTTEDIIRQLGWWNTTGGGDGPWENIEETDYMLVKNGIVVEVGHSKNLPDYDKC